MFSNQHTQTLDNRGRLLLPARWRKELGSSAVVTRGLDSCLFLFPLQRFSTLARQLERLGLGKADARALSRHLFAEAIDHAVDRRGRLQLSPQLLKFAGIDGQAVFVGANDRIEIWNPERYAQLDTQLQSQAAAIAERVEGDLQKAPEAAEESK